MLIGINDGKRGKGKRACCGDVEGPCECGGKGPLGPMGPLGATGALGAGGVRGLRHLGGLGKKVRGAKKVGRVRGLRLNGLGGLEGLGDNDLLDAGERATFLGLGEIGDMGELADLADTLDTSASYLTPAQIMRAADTFDVSLNSWLFDFAKAAAKLPKALVEQVDGFVTRWREVKNSFYIFETVRIKDMVAAMAEWNGLRDAVASYGVKSVVGPATVSVNGQQVAADKIPYTPDFLTQIGTYAKWGGVLVAVGLAYKVSSDLGLLKNIGNAAWWIGRGGSRTAG